MTRILAFAGTKQAGKTTSSNFIHGYQLRAHGIIDNFAVMEDGTLYISSENSNGGILDVNRNDPEFAEWASYNMWPYVRVYSFASVLKEMSVNLFDLKRENIYGNNQQKNKATNYRWEDMPGIVSDENMLKSKHVKELIDSGNLSFHKSGRMSHREFLQFFGTKICRKIYDEIWHEITINKILTEEPLIALIDDCRFINEVEAIKANGGKVIYLSRNPYEDDDISENELKNYDEFDYIIDNTDMSIHDTNVEIIKAIEQFGWLGEEINVKQKTTNDSGIHTFRKDA